MTRNHLSQGLLPMQVVPGWELPGYGYGLGFGVSTDAVQAKLIGSEGLYFWDGIEGTWFWVDPKEELIGLLSLHKRHKPLVVTACIVLEPSIVFRIASWFLASPAAK